MAQHVQNLIDELLDRIAWPTANNAAHRAKCLLALNNQEKTISQRGSWEYLSVRTTLGLNNGVQKLVVPSSPQFDPLKAAAIADDLGPLTYLPVGDFDSIPLDTAYLIVRTNRPGYWTLARDGASGLTIFFDKANTIGSTITFNITYQQTVLALTDANNSFSLLPEGYEKTILLDAAELELKRILRIPIPQWKLEDFKEAMQMFYAANRTTKPEAKTDEDIQDAKGYERVMAPGV